MCSQRVEELLARPLRPRIGGLKQVDAHHRPTCVAPVWRERPYVVGDNPKDYVWPPCLLIEAEPLDQSVDIAGRNVALGALGTEKVCSVVRRSADAGPYYFVSQPLENRRVGMELAPFAAGRELAHEILQPTGKALSGS